MNKHKLFLTIFSGLLVLFLSIGALLARTNSKDAYNYLTIFTNVIHLVDANYVEEVNFDKIMDSAIYGMVESLDPESFFLKGKDLELYKKQLAENGSRAGVGITLAKRYGMVTVVAVEKNSEAYEKKIKPGDYIRSIQDQHVQNMPLYQIYHLLKGAPGTKVKVSIFTNTMEKPQDHILTRRAVTRPYIESYVAEHKIGYIRVAHLLPGVEQEIENKLNSFKSQGIVKLILDLRSCTDDSQETAVKVADLFLPAVPIVQISGRTGTKRTITGNSKVVFRGNLLVLTDPTTAGSAEIVAGAIQDSGAGKVYGLRTYGRGGIQQLVPAGENFVYLTTEKYLTPKGRVILNNGIEPAIPFQDDVKSARQNPDADRILNKAIEYLRHNTEKAAA